MDNNLLLQLYRCPETVFTVDEISQIFPDISYESLRDRLYYFAKTGKLKRLHQGIYAKDIYNPYELANKVYRPSYISLETVLSKAGIVFQHYRRIFAVSYITRAVTIDKMEIQYRQIRKDVLVNTEGLEKKPGYFIATPERAILDAIYIYKNYHFDHLGVINWDKALMLSKIYKSQALGARLKDYHKIYQEEYAHR